MRAAERRVTRLSAGAWLVDPFSLRGVYPLTLSDGLLLHVPYICWFTVYLLIILVWAQVYAAFSSDVARLARTRCVVWLGIFAMVALALPCAVIGVAGIAPTAMRYTSDGVIAAAGAGVVVYAVAGYRRVATVVGLSVDGGAITALQRRQLQQLLETTRWTISLGGVFGAIMVTAVTTMLVMDIEPQTGGKAYLGVLFVIHVLVEGGLALTALYATRRVHNGELLSVWATVKAACVCGAATDGGEDAPDGVGEAPLLREAAANIEQRAV